MNVLTCVCADIVNKPKDWLAIKPGSTHHVSLKCPVSSEEYDYCYQIVRFYVIGVCFYCTLVFLLFLSFPLVVDFFPSVIVCHPDLFLLIDVRLLDTGIKLLPLLVLFN